MAFHLLLELMMILSLQDFFCSLFSGSDAIWGSPDAQFRRLLVVADSNILDEALDP